MKQASYERLAGWAAILAGISGFIYSLSFVVISQTNPDLGHLLNAKFLILGGLLSLPVFVGLYTHFKDTDEALATLALILGVAGALGAMIHGAYDLANTVNPPVYNPLNQADLPNAIDPRGFLTFGITGVATLFFAWFMQEHRSYSNGLALLGFVLGLLLIVMYTGRLIVLDASNPIISYPALLVGFILSPLWYIWLGNNMIQHKK